ncbi:carbonate dehydratase [Pseudomaricurvus alkylphenolicus]|jgi:carbonic anhydrase|uniref:carbonate dehydratase n=1 Tax=Pseudomaricurvus alkylphenolicus TaxID=1306991 RepID=UPI00141DF8FC|nr:carbonate dehydratase [Pseudomaricurvus alkylphenolicus]NIB41829.1 carbonate dehydratase [Pseudomaricurvus alkylphenolicus]
MSKPEDLLENNKSWAADVESANPGYFNSLAQQQTPEYLWIGCSDSRIAANQIVGMEPGSIFVHRNIANVVVHTDLNCLSVIQYAVEVLKVKHIVVVGHYGCGGVLAALGEANNGLIDNWLEHIRDVYRKHQTAVDSAVTEKERANRLCELNVIAQVGNVAETTIVRNAWRAGQDLTLHGWIYGLEDGIVRDLKVTRDQSSLT